MTYITGKAYEDVGHTRDIAMDHIMSFDQYIHDNITSDTSTPLTSQTDSAGDESTACTCDPSQSAEVTANVHDMIHAAAFVGPFTPRPTTTDPVPMGDVLSPLVNSSKDCAFPAAPFWTLLSLPLLLEHPWTVAPLVHGIGRVPEAVQATACPLLTEHPANPLNTVPSINDGWVMTDDVWFILVLPAFSG